MKIFEKLKNRKMLKNILFTYTAILFIPLIVIGILLNGVVVKRMRENETGQYEIQVGNMAERLNVTFMDFQKLSGTFSQNSDFSAYSIENDAIAGMKAVVNIRQLVVSNSLIDDIYYKSYMSDKIITKDGIYTAENMIRDINKYPKGISDKIIKSMSETKKSVVFAAEAIEVDSVSEEAITYIIPIGTGTPIASITLIINKNALDKLISDLLNGRFDEICVKDAESTVITAVGSIKDDTKSKYITISKSIGMFGYTVTSLCRKSEIYKNSNTTRLLIFAVMVIIAICGMVLIVVLSYRSYAPIANLNRKITGLVENDSLTDDEYENLNLGIEMLNDNVKKYQMLNEDLKKQVKHIMLKNLIFDSKAKLSGDYFDIRERACYGVFAAYYNGMPEREAMEKIKCLNIDPLDMDIYYIEAKEEKIIGVIAADNHEEIIALLEDKIKILGETGIKITIGNFYRDIEGISKSYSDIVSHSENDNNEYPYNEITAMVELLKDFEFEKACEKVKEIFAKNYDTMPNMFLKCIAANVLSSFISGIAAENILNARLISIYKEGIGIVSESTDIKAVADTVYDCCVDLKESILDNIEKNKGIAYKLLNYVNDNCFDSNMSIKSISNELDISPSVASGVFKQETGVNLSKYLWERRLAEAKRLLAETDMSVNDISAAIGYDIPNSFIRKFRSCEGVTPNEWRKQNK